MSEREIFLINDVRKN